MRICSLERDLVPGERTRDEENDDAHYGRNPIGSVKGALRAWYPDGYVAEEDENE